MDNLQHSKAQLMNQYLLPTDFKLVSGGQTGADVAGRDWALENNIAHGGWCPRGRKSEDGSIGQHYHLVETPSSGYLQRTEWNVRDSDATEQMQLNVDMSGPRAAPFGPTVLPRVVALAAAHAGLPRPKYAGRTIALPATHSQGG